MMISVLPVFMVWAYSLMQQPAVKVDLETEMLVDYTLDELAEVLDPGRFFRINRA